LAPFSQNGRFSGLLFSEWPFGIVGNAFDIKKKKKA
jgi:hypothetical protein